MRHSMPVLFGANGYIYDLFVKLGLSDFAARTIEFIVVRPLKIALILLGAMLLGRIAGRAARKFIRTGYHRSPVVRPSTRSAQRADTVGEVASSVVRGVILAVALFMVLDELGVDLAPLLAGAGIAGLAIGFGAQSLVKDVISGLFVLLEDQYGVGDVVTLGDSRGTVEDVTLRVTRLRALDGTVWFVPNGEIRRVGNSSMEWSRAIVDVFVPRGTDVMRAAADALDEANAVAEQLTVLEPPEMWGVHQTTTEGVTLRVAVKVAPGDQAAVTRELRTRVAARLARGQQQAHAQVVVGRDLGGGVEPGQAEGDVVDSPRPSGEPWRDGGAGQQP